MLHTYHKISSISSPWQKDHYENTPIRIYRKFHNQIKRKKISDKNFYIFHISAQNIDRDTRLNRLGEAVLTSNHNL